MNSTLEKTIRDIGRHWWTLFLTHLLYTAIAAMLLTPLVSLLFHGFIRFSGKSILADQDMLFFLLDPVGWIGIVTVGTLWLAILVLGQAAQMAILAAPDDTEMGVVGSLQYALAHAWQINQVTALLLIRTMLLVVPFLATAAVIYSLLLTRFDINYYLQEKPPEFVLAVTTGIVLSIAMSALLLRCFSSWVFALPLVIFEGIPARKALQESRSRVQGSRTRIILVFTAWLFSGIGLSSAATSLVIWVGRTIVPDATATLSILVMTLGVFLMIWMLIHLLINLLSSTTFSSLLLNLYREMACDDERIDVPVPSSGSTPRAFSGLRITGRRLVVGCLLGLAAAAGTGILAMKSVRLDDDVEIIAHRGASASAPENTLAAMHQAIAEQTDWVEIDVQETRDDEVVVFHDSDFMKLANIDLKIWDATLDDLGEIDIGSHKSRDFKNERVPTLAELLTTCKGQTGVVIELKYYGHDKNLERRVLDLVEAHDMTSEVMYMSLNLDAVVKMKQLNPECRVGLLLSVVSGDVQDTVADFFAVNAMFVNRSFIQNAHASGKDVYAWTVNDGVTMSRMIGIGIDGLITDKPGLARRVLTERSSLNAAERLILELSEAFGVTPVIDGQ